MPVINRIAVVSPDNMTIDAVRPTAGISPDYVNAFIVSVSVDICGEKPVRNIVGIRENETMRRFTSA